MAEKTLFRKVDYNLRTLLDYIEMGDIGLPDIQRPFVWSSTKVRDLLDSMYRGFPVGNLVFWEMLAPNGARQIASSAQHPPNRLVIDGQQRLTSLYAVVRGKEVVNHRYEKHKITIAFRPRDGHFEVSNAAIRKDPEWLPDISVLWQGNRSSWHTINDFLESLKQAKGPLCEADEEIISRNLDRVYDLQDYPFTAIEISSSVSEAEVADIFVRINSEGVRLNQSDFILTLMSVFWDEGRQQLEEFCRQSKDPPGPLGLPSPFNYLIEPQPAHLLRVAVAAAFHRADLAAAYNLLRGKDVETGQVDDKRREEQFAKLKAAQERVLHLTRWHEFLKAIRSAGFVASDLISSKIALMYAYVVYLLAKDDFGLPEYDAQRLTSRWFYFVSLTSRYTGSPESTMEQDLSRLRGITQARDFCKVLEDIAKAALTDDYWTVTLPQALETSSADNPQRFGFVAALILLKAPVLFSEREVRELVDPALKQPRKPLEWHHLFPRSYLEKQGITERRIINQQANLALLEWPDNSTVRDRPPAEYVPELRRRFSDDEWARMHELHGLPIGWEHMDYEEFLTERRKLMAGIIRRGYEALL